MAEGETAHLDGQMAAWRQGDAVFLEQEFVHLADLARPLTREAEDARAATATELVERSVASVFTAVPGWVVLTQTCDIVRSCRDRPFVEVAPLTVVKESRLREVKAGLLVNQAYVPAAATRRLVADLDRVMTVEKAVLARLPRTPGWSDDDEARDFGRALARKRARWAFPDDFVEGMRPLQRRIRRKHGNRSDEGRLLDALREIRVHASPDWNAPRVVLRFLFVKRLDPQGLEEEWPAQADTWLKLINCAGARFAIANPEVGRLEDFTASDYVESDQLDLDWLSGN